MRIVSPAVLPCPIAALSFGALISSYSVCAAAAGVGDYFPVKADPFVGDWSGRWTSGETVDPELHAQIVALGDERYCITLVAKLDMRCPAKAVAEAVRTGDTIEFRDGRITGTVRGDRITGQRDGGKATFELEKVERVSPTLGLAPPANAVVLFDGSSLDAWQPANGWQIHDGAMMVAPKAKDIYSRETFTDIDLHIEFRTPFMPGARGQARGNSGVFVQDVYEVQVLDSYALEGYYDECGALYKVAAPMVNAARPPLQWQTYDIQYRAARFDESGALAENPRMTVHHNGVLIHNDQDIPWITAWTEEERVAPHRAKPGHIRLQAHGNYVQFRNVWLIDRNEKS